MSAFDPKRTLRNARIARQSHGILVAEHGYKLALAMEKLTGRVAEMTRQEWREFGVYYISNDEARAWHLHGSKACLLQFAALLEKYGANPARAEESEHEHLGPHWYLTLTTYPEARLDGRGIWGKPTDFERLGHLLRDVVNSASPGQICRIREQYTPTAEYDLILHVETDSFDPSSLDPQLAR